MAIYQVANNESSSGTVSLADASAAASGGLYSGNHVQTATSIIEWDVSGFNSITFTWQNDMAVYYWTNPAGSYTNGTRSCYLVLSDGTELKVGEGDSGISTLDLSQYTDEQKVSVRLRGKVNYYLSTITNAADKGSIIATNVFASGLSETGKVYHEIGKLFEFAGSNYVTISKVLDWNGTSASLIFSGEESLLGDFLFLDEGYVNVEGQMTQTSNSLTVSANSRAGFAGGMAHVYTLPLDLSSFTQIVVNVTEFYRAPKITMCRFGIAQSLEAAESAATFYGQGNAKALGFPIAYADITGTGTFTCDIPSGTTNAVVILAFGTNYDGGTTGSRYHVSFDSFSLS